MRSYGKALETIAVVNNVRAKLGLDIAKDGGSDNFSSVRKDYIALTVAHGLVRDLKKTSDGTPRESRRDSI